MTDDRNNTRDRRRSQEQESDRVLRRFFAAVHADDRVPSFRDMTNPSALVRGLPALWRPAVAVVAVVLMAIGISWLLPALREPRPDSLSEPEQLALAEGLSSFETPLDFLLETPGREFLYAPASFELLENFGEDTP